MKNPNKHFGQPSTVKSCHSEGHHDLFFRVISKTLVLLSYSKDEMPICCWIFVYLENISWFSIIIQVAFRIQDENRSQGLILDPSCQQVLSWGAKPIQWLYSELMLIKWVFSWRSQPDVWALICYPHKAAGLLQGRRLRVSPSFPAISFGGLGPLGSSPVGNPLSPLQSLDEKKGELNAGDLKDSRSLGAWQSKTLAS